MSILKNKTAFEQKGADWYSDRYESIRVERNRYFILLIVALMALIGSIIANVLLMPLKTSVPYLVELNKMEDVATVVKPMDIEKIKNDPSVTLYFLYKYLNARMSYNFGLRQVQADTVRALSTSAVYQNYVNLVDVSNPQSPIRLYQNSSTIKTKITGYSFPYPNIAQVHFYTELSGNTASSANQAPSRQYWLATIKFTYSPAALSTGDRLEVNPVGFFVTDFQLTQETPNGG